MKNRGEVRGGANTYAKLILCAAPPYEVTQEEKKALVENYSKEFGIKCDGWEGIVFYFNTRKDFSLFPLIIRRFESHDYIMHLSMHDEDPGKIYLKEDPALFYKEVAASMCYYERCEHECE